MKATVADTNSRVSGYEITLQDGRRISIVRAAASADEPVGLSNHPRVLMHPHSDGAVAGGLHGGVPRAVVGAFSEGREVAVAWLQDSEGKEATVLGILGMKIERSWVDLGLEVALAREIGVAARELGYAKLTTWLPYLANDLLASLGAAGLHLTSCLDLGGTAEIVVDVNLSTGATALAESASRPAPTSGPKE